MARMWPTAFVLLVLTTAFSLAADTQIKLEDIERDNLSVKQQKQLAQQQQQQQQEHEQQQQQHQQQQNEQQTQSKPEQEQSSTPEEQAGQPFNYQQLFLQHLQAYQPQYTAPPSGGAVALYPAFLGGNQLGIPHDVILAPPHAASAPAYPQQIYIPQGGIPGLQFVPAHQAAPFIYTNPQAPVEVPKTVQTPAQENSQSAATKDVSSSPAGAGSQIHSQPPSHVPRVPPHNFQQPRGHGQVPPAGPGGVASPNFAYTPQQHFNPIPKELQSYTTIPDSVYQGKEPEYIYDQQQPSISLTNDQFTQYNNLYQQSQSQRPIFSPGVKSVVPPSLKSFPGSGSFFTRNSFLSPTRHFPGPGISYTSYRSGPGAF